MRLIRKSGLNLKVQIAVLINKFSSSGNSIDPSVCIKIGTVFDEGFGIFRVHVKEQFGLYF